MDRSGATRAPIVSVVIPCWNVEPYLRECLDSVLAQTIGLERIEIIAVDDASTDGTVAILDEYAALHPEIAVIRERHNSGGPGRPRNIGLAQASAPYVFFLDADDYLGAEALARLIATAERNGSDIVLGKVVGTDGRVAPSRWAVRRNIDRASVIEVYDTGSVLKLFRRSLLERTGLQFEEGLASDEDGPFAARAYFEASGISVCADYNFYFLRSRPGSQTRRLDRIEDLAEGIVRIDSQRMALVAAYRKPGVGRDALMIKHIADVLRPFRDGRWLRLDVAERSRVFEVASSVIRRWHTRWIDLALPPWLAVRAYCLRLGLLAELVDIAGCPPGIGYAAPIVDGRRIYARWPHFRDAAGIPDRYFDITSRVAPQIRVTRLSVDAAELHISGEAFLALLGGSTALLLRRWPRGRRLRFETAAAPTPNLRDRQTRYPQAGFDGTIHLPTAEAGGPISPGIWRILLSIQAGGITRTAAVTTSEVIERANSVPVEAGARAIGPWCIQTTPTGEFRLRVYPVPRVAASLELAAGYGVRLVQALARPVLVSRPGRLALAALNEIRPAYAATLRRSIRGGPSATNR